MSGQALFTAIPFSVIEISKASPRALGQLQFRAAPRKGEYITLDGEDGQGQNYEVLAVIHPSEPQATAGDLLVRHTGSDTDFRSSFGRNIVVV